MHHQQQYWPNPSIPPQSYQGQNTIPANQFNLDSRKQFEIESENQELHKQLEERSKKIRLHENRIDQLEKQNEFLSDRLHVIQKRIDPQSTKWNIGHIEDPVDTLDSLINELRKNPTNISSVNRACEQWEKLRKCLPQKLPIPARPEPMHHGYDHKMPVDQYHHPSAYTPSPQGNFQYTPRPQPNEGGHPYRPSQPNVNFQYNQQPNVKFQNPQQPNVNFQNPQQPNVNFQNPQQPNVNFQYPQQANLNYPHDQGQPNIGPYSYDQQVHVGNPPHNPPPFNVGNQPHNQSQFGPGNQLHSVPLPVAGHPENIPIQSPYPGSNQQAPRQYHPTNY